MGFYAKKYINIICLNDTYINSYIRAIKQKIKPKNLMFNLYGWFFVIFEVKKTDNKFS